MCSDPELRACNKVLHKMIFCANGPSYTSVPRRYRAYMAWPAVMTLTKMSRGLKVQRLIPPGNHEARMSCAQLRQFATIVFGHYCKLLTKAGNCWDLLKNRWYWGKSFDFCPGRSLIRYQPVAFEYLNSPCFKNTEYSAQLDTSLRLVWFMTVRCSLPEHPDNPHSSTQTKQA